MTSTSLLAALGRLVPWGDTILDRVTDASSRIERGASALAHVPAQLEVLITALHATAAALDRALPELTRTVAAMNDRLENVDKVATELASELARTSGALDRLLPEVSAGVSGMDDRLRHLDHALSELSHTVIALVDRIPGMRRFLQRSGPPDQ